MLSMLPYTCCYISVTYFFIDNTFTRGTDLVLNKDTDPNVRKMGEILKMHRLENFVKCSTHKSGNILDLVIANENSLFVSEVDVEAENTVSDHKKVFFEINVNHARKTEKIIWFQNKSKLCSGEYSSLLIEKMNLLNNEMVCNHDSTVGKCVDCLTELYISVSKSYVDEKAPEVEKTIKITANKQNKWYNNDIKYAKSRLRRVEKKLYRNKTEENRIEFNRLRQEKCNLVEEVKKKYYMEKIKSCGSNFSDLYRLLNGLIGKNLISAKLPSGHSLETLPEKCIGYFIDKMKKINESFTNPKNSYMTDFPLLGFNQFKPVYEEEVKNILCGINKT